MHQRPIPPFDEFYDTHDDIVVQSYAAEGGYVDWLQENKGEEHAAVPRCRSLADRAIEWHDR